MKLSKQIVALSFLLSTTFTQASPDEEAISVLRDIIEKQYKNLVTCDGNQYAIRYYSANAWEVYASGIEGKIPPFEAFLQVKGGKWTAIPQKLTEADRLNGIQWKGRVGFQVTAMRWYPMPGALMAKNEKPGWSQWVDPLKYTPRNMGKKEYWLFDATMIKTPKLSTKSLPTGRPTGATTSPWGFSGINGLSTKKGVSCSDIEKLP